MPPRRESIVVWVGEQGREGHGYTVHFEPEPFGGYTAHFPVIPAIKPYGETYEYVRKRAAEALLLHLERLANRGEPAPEGDAVTGSEYELESLRRLAAAKQRRGKNRP